MARLDPHSYCDSEQATVTHLKWQGCFDFERHILDCEATLLLSGSIDGPLDLDTRDLAIETVTDVEGAPLLFSLAPAEPILGSRLRVELRSSTGVRIRYHTSSEASALKWLEPLQTRGGAAPFLFSQCQAIHARSLLPITDTPRTRITFEATLDIPADLRALMAAEFVDRREQSGQSDQSGRAIEHWRMEQPIPPYLFAVAVGRLASRELGPRSRVWAEPEVVEEAAQEFAGVDAMLSSAETLFGPYPWERFDLLVMPPAFPYGGMENPRLTFLTPTLIVGDRSLVNVVAHELAHSWTGNLITNASAEHFWLNEGFTVYAERRIVEALSGREVSELDAALGLIDLERAFSRFAAQPALTRLQTELSGIDPDDAFSEVPYEKGYLFLRSIEERVGRPRFDRFLSSYISTFRFSSITTADFERFVEKELPGVLEEVGAARWLREPGLPADAPRPRSERLDRLARLLSQSPIDLNEETARALGPVEWRLYLERLPRPLSREAAEALDRRFQLTKSRNPEILMAWLEVALASGLDVMGRIEEVLHSVGRMKYLRPLYRALLQRDREWGRAVFESARAGYHPIAQQMVESLL